MKIAFVDERKLRQLFNDSPYLERVMRGEYTTKVLYDERAHSDSNQPRGTRSKRIGYYDENGQQVAIVHQFELPDGSIGGSGKPDPKEVLVGDTVYLLFPQPRGPFRIGRLRRSN